jgi:hypothetical protein
MSFIIKPVTVSLSSVSCSSKLTEPEEKVVGSPVYSLSVSSMVKPPGAYDQHLKGQSWGLSLQQSHTVRTELDLELLSTASMLFYFMFNF